MPLFLVGIFDLEELQAVCSAATLPRGSAPGLAAYLGARQWVWQAGVELWQTVCLRDILRKVHLLLKTPILYEHFANTILVTHPVALLPQRLERHCQQM